jgi:hypothetical protein
MQIKKFISKILILISLYLLIISFYGLFNDPYRQYKKINGLNSTEYFYKALDASFLKNGPSEVFLSEYMKLIDLTLKYEWPDDVEYMPIEDNWMIYVLRLFDPFIAKNILSDQSLLFFEKIEIPKYKDAFRRGFGICSQQSLATSDILHTRYKMNSKVAGLNGHVVVQLYNMNGQNYILDPSYRLFTKGDVLHPNILDKNFLANIEQARSIYLSVADNFISKKYGWGGTRNQDINFIQWC